MLFYQILMGAVAAGVLAGIGDKLLGNRLGLGDKFTEGLSAMVPLVTGMAGILCLVPVISRWIGPVITPFCRLIHADPALFGAVLACDMGGYPLAMELSQDPEMGRYFGILAASSVGTAISFYIPVGLNMIETKDQPLFARGVLTGIIVSPLGIFIGGLAAGFSLHTLLPNTIPLIVLSLLLALALKTVPAAMIRGCCIFGKAITAVCLIGLAAAAVEMLTGFVVIPGMNPLEESLGIVARLAVVLAGSLPVLELLFRGIRRFMRRIGELTGLNEASVGGLIVNLANSVLVFPMLKEMDDRGKVLCTAVVITGSAVLGDHMAYTAAVCPQMLFSLVISKIAGGILTVILAMALLRGSAESGS